MKKVALHHSEVLNGAFDLRPLNLLFVFQVNCPGCFIHGIPLVNQLSDMFRDRLSILGLSTAFEDFELNTLQNTKDYLDTGKLVGETARYFHKLQSAKVPTINFPVAFDELVSGQEFVTNVNIEHICNLNPNFQVWPKWEQASLGDKIHTFYNVQPIVPKSFTLNQLRGTPSFVFFNDQLEVVLEHFGGLDLSKLSEWLNSKLK